MKKILIPIDFYKVSYNALEYAFKFFGEEAEYKVLHVVDGISINDPMILELGLTRNQGIRENIKSRVEELEKKLNIKVKYNTVIEIGTVIEGILSIAESEEVDAIVMGTRDKYDLMDRLFGTISLGVVKRCSIPVYLIPPKAKYKTVSKVVVGADFHFESDKLLENLAAWNSEFKADIHFLHIKQGKIDNDKFVRKIVEEYFDNRNVEFPFSIVEEEEKNISKKIIEYSDKENADLQVIVTDKASWLDTMTSKSISKEMILKATRPMLFLHSGMARKARLFFDTVVTVGI